MKPLSAGRDSPACSVAQFLHCCCLLRRRLAAPNPIAGCPACSSGRFQVQLLHCNRRWLPPLLAMHLGAKCATGNPSAIDPFPKGPLKSKRRIDCISLVLGDAITHVYHLNKEECHMLAKCNYRLSGDLHSETSLDRDSYLYPQQLPLP